MQPNDESNVLTQAKIIWGSLIATTFVYLIILIIQPPREAFDPGAFVTILSVVASFVWLVAFFLPDFLLKNTLKKIPKPRPLLSVLGPYYVLFIFRMVLFELVIVCGFLSAFVSGRLHHYYPFWAFGLFGMLLSFPSKSSIKSKADK